MASSHLFHASCVVLGELGVLLAGDSGAGKSDLALRLIDQGAQLVADDQTEVFFDNNKLFASPPASIAGMLEIRHVGLFRLPFVSRARVALYVELVPQGVRLDRYPEPDSIFLLDQSVKRLRLAAYESSTPAKIRAALHYTCVE